MIAIVIIRLWEMGPDALFLVRRVAAALRSLC